ncbi:ethanolamine ammonia-lyase subunit EutB [Halopseudomonas pachastrellae]|nr:ethanolamine ammonia-lyase subunit EutB [Halopseudomonas pachastrellae]
MIGINPATDSMSAVCTLLEMLDAVIQRYEIPTQSCVLTHVTSSIAAIERGAPLDLVFQSIAGTEAAMPASASASRCCRKATKPA